jgi:hypothetical protein
MKRVSLILAPLLSYLSLFTVTAPASFVHLPQPLIGSVRVADLTSSSATISWLTSVSADSQVAYGTTGTYGSLTGLDPARVRTHVQPLSALTPNTLYHFEVLSRAATGTLYSAGDFTFSTPALVIEGMISGLSVSRITMTSAVISWATSSPANAIVEYGNSFSYGQFSQLAPEFATSHTIVLSGLNPQSLYHFRVRSTDGAGNLGITADSTFSTAEDDTPNLFAGISASEIGSATATIAWMTNAPASTQIDYGTGTDYGKSTPLDTTLVTSHSQTLAGLTANALYHYRVRSTDGAGNPWISPDRTFSTLPILLYYPQFNPTADTFTGIAVSNFDPGTAILTFTAFGASGREMLSDDLADPVNKSLPAGTQFALTQDQLFGPGVSGLWPVGWTMVNASSPQLAGFFMIFSNSLSALDGAGISADLLSSFVFPETGSYDSTTLLLANPNPVQASITIDLLKTDGTVRGGVQASIPAWGVYSADLVTATFAGLSTDPSDYVRVVSSQGLIAHEFSGNASRDVADLAGQDLAGGAKALYSPQYAVGDGYTSTVSIVNLDPNPGTVMLELIGDDGSQLGSTRVVSVAAGGKIYISGADFFFGSAPSKLTQGYVRITSSDVRLAGSVTFSDSSNSTFTTALPLVSTLGKSQVLSHVASNSTFFTGLAILNPNSKDASVKIDVYDDAGQKYASLAESIPAGHRVSRLLTEYFPSLVGQERSSGYLRVTADEGVACFGLFGTHNLSALSAIPTQPVR